MRTTIFALFILVATGCELVVDIDVPAEKPKLTLNAFFTPDSTWHAELTLSRYILDDNPYQPVNDAVVTIHQNGNLVATLLHQGDGHYKAAGSPVAGQAYEIRAESTVYGRVQSQSFVPEPVVIEDVQLDMPPTQPTTSNPEVPITLVFQDRPGEANYYQILIYMEHRAYDEEGNEHVYYWPTHLESDDPALNNGELFDDSRIGYFNDVQFEGKRVTIRLKGLYWNFYGYRRALVVLRCLSEDLYRYETTRELQEETTGNPFAQPVQVYNNIANGFGIFAGYSQSVFVLEN